MKKLVSIIAGLAALSSCATIQYKVPPGAKTVPIKISSNMTKSEMMNIKVRYQGANSCANYPGQLMAMVNSATIGIKGGNPVIVEITVGEPQIVSVMGAVPLDVGMFDVLFQHQREKVAQDYGNSLRELYFSFTPKEQHEYSIEFNFTGKDIDLVAFEQKNGDQKVPLESLPLPENCKNNPIHNI